MGLNRSEFPSRRQLAFLIACAVALAVDVVTGIAGMTLGLISIKLGLSGAKIPGFALVLIAISVWAFNYRIVLAAVAFCVGFVVALVRLRPRNPGKAGRD